LSDRAWRHTDYGENHRNNPRSLDIGKRRFLGCFSTIPDNSGGIDITSKARSWQEDLKKHGYTVPKGRPARVCVENLAGPLKTETPSQLVYSTMYWNSLQSSALSAAASMTAPRHTAQ
jgi:hypothetical protein